MADIFISHSGNDNEIAAAIGERLQRERPTWSLFYDKDNIRAGQRWQERLRDELTDAAKREFGSDSCLFSPPWGGSGGLGGSLCFPFPTPGNGQQESRLAPIGRHLRLLRRGVLRTGCFPRQAAFQGGHEIDDGWRGRDLPGFNGEPLHLGFD